MLRVEVFFYSPFFLFTLLIFLGGMEKREGTITLLYISKETFLIYILKIKVFLCIPSILWPYSSSVILFTIHTIITMIKTFYSTYYDIKLPITAITKKKLDEGHLNITIWIYIYAISYHSAKLYILCTFRSESDVKKNQG